MKFSPKPRFESSEAFLETAKVSITEKLSIPQHVPTAIFQKQTNRPNSSQSSLNSNIPFCNNLFPSSCSKYPRLKSLVNIGKQSPRKEFIVIKSTSLEYDPCFNLVFPRPTTATIKIEKKKKV